MNNCGVQRERRMIVKQLTEFQIAMKVMRERMVRASTISSDMVAKVAKGIAIPLDIVQRLQIDYERIEQITNNNSKYGWTLTGNFGISAYLNDDLLDQPLEYLDDYFYGYYQDDEWSHYKETKEAILEEIDSKWTEILDECFACVERDQYKVAIPTLISIIEGEISELSESEMVGKGLISIFKEKIGTDKRELDAIMLYSLHHFLESELFIRRDFADSRRQLINRHWVVHGRDDPKHWTKVDALRLINVLSTIQYAKGALQEEVE